MDEETEGKFMLKVKKDPLMPLGLVGLTSIVIYGLYNFRRRKSLSASLYLIHLRLAAQGTLIGCMTLGLGYSLFQNKKLMEMMGIKTESSNKSENRSDSNKNSDTE